MKLYEHSYASKYSENIIIHKDEVDASWQNKNTTHATIGMRRKGIAIAFVPLHRIQ